jgi:uncharacterized membrane protein YedE/YeeE
MHAPTTPQGDLTLDQDGATAADAVAGTHAAAWFGYLAAGTMLGILFAQSEVLSWYRIQEMFRFQNLHMFGVIGVAVAVAFGGQWLIRRLGSKTLAGHPVTLADKACTPSNARYWGGGLVFGLGWALLGACPGPIFTLIGLGQTVYVVPLAAAVAGTWTYAALQERLPH